MKNERAYRTRCYPWTATRTFDGLMSRRMIPFWSACCTPSQTWLKSSRRSLMVKRCLSQHSLIGIPNDERPPVDLKTVRRATDSDISIQMTAASSRSPKWPRSFWPRRSRSSSSTVLRHRTWSPAVASADTDTRPTQSMYAVFEDVSRRFETQRSRLQKLVTEAVRPLLED